MTHSEGLIICAGALDRFGEKHQMVKAIEEMGELTRALCKRVADAEDVDVDNICEEIADLEITITQLHMIFDDGLIQKKKAEKLTALRERVNGWRNGKLRQLAEHLKGDCGGDACRL